jgi:hypothetical protein
MKSLFGVGFLVGISSLRRHLANLGSPPMDVSEAREVR